MGEVSLPRSQVPSPAGLRSAVGDGVSAQTGVSFPGIGDPADERWEMGYTLRVPACRPIVAGPTGCTITGEPRDWDPARPLVWDDGHPFGISAQVECSEPVDDALLISEARDAYERAVFPQIAAELYLGTQARAQDWDGNRWLTRSDDPVDPVTILAETPGTLAGAVGLLESYLACCMDGGHGVLHIPPALLAPMSSEYLIIDPALAGGRRYSSGGHVVVAECGYDGSAPGTAAAGPQTPDEGVLWLYATGPLVARATTSQLIGTDKDVAAFIASTNDHPVEAQGFAMATWGCCHAAVPVDVSEWFVVGE